MGLVSVDGKAAHLALDRARVAASSAGDQPFLEYLLQHDFMERFSVPRGG